VALLFSKPVADFVCVTLRTDVQNGSFERDLVMNLTLMPAPGRYAIGRPTARKPITVYEFGRTPGIFKWIRATLLLIVM